MIVRARLKFPPGKSHHLFMSWVTVKPNRDSDSIGIQYDNDGREMNEGRGGRQVDAEALRSYILMHDSAWNLRLPPLLIIDFTPQGFVPIPKDKKLQSNSHHAPPFPNTTRKQALSQSPGRRETINWAEIQNTQGGGGNEMPINHINMLKSGRTGWTPTQS